MAFGTYKALGEAMAAFQVTGVREEFIQPKPFAMRDFFRTELQATLEECPVDCSEWAVCENLIYPVLREVARTYTKELVVWSHVTLYHTGELLGVPDYLIAKRSPLGTEVMGNPVAMIMEAKRNDLTGDGANAWPPCARPRRSTRTSIGSFTVPCRMVSCGVSASSRGIP